MNPDYTNLTREYLIREIQELEDTYADALGDEADAATLTVLWNKIKMLTHKIGEIDQSEEGLLLNTRHLKSLQ